MNSFASFFAALYIVEFDASDELEFWTTSSHLFLLKEDHKPFFFWINTVISFRSSFCKEIECSTALHVFFSEGISYESPTIFLLGLAVKLFSVDIFKNLRNVLFIVKLSNYFIHFFFYFYLITFNKCNNLVYFAKYYVKNIYIAILKLYYWKRL